MKSIPVTFKFKGDRDYIHGSDLFNYFEQQVKPSYEYITNIDFSMHEIIHQSQGEFVLISNKAMLSELTNIKVKGSFILKEEKFWFAYLFNNNQKISNERYDYNENLIIERCHIHDSAIIINGIENYTFIENIVAMNKYLLQQLFFALDGRFVFTRITLSFLSDMSGDIMLQYHRNIKQRFFVTHIFLNGKVVGELYFNRI